MSDVGKLPIEIDVQSVAELKNRGDDFLLLDVREQDEYDFTKIDGSYLFPMSRLKTSIAELEEHRDRHIVVHCHHGGRSLHVTKALKEQGFARVQNMAGGIDAWSQQIDASVRRY